jgi:hypothetical protein
VHVDAIFTDLASLPGIFHNLVREIATPGQSVAGLTTPPSSLGAKRDLLVIVPPQTVTFIADPWLISRPGWRANIEAGITLGGKS